MNKTVVLSLGNGSFEEGFPAVTAQLWEPGNLHMMKFTGSLPAAPEIPELYRAWQLLYRALYQRLDWHPRIKIRAGDVTNVSEVEFSGLCQRLSDAINTWLNSEPFRPIDQQLRAQLQPLEEIRVIVETKDTLLQRLPWHLWNFFEDYPKAEVALGAPEYQPPNHSPLKIPNTKVRILAILGNSQEIDVSKDRAFLEQFSNQAETEFLVEPQPNQLNDRLWEHGWDILFFAGHSSSQKTGLLQLNQTDSLTLDQLKYALKKAISRGLKLAIFNSCDGLGLAKSLADLHIPQVIVMREPVADVVAQEFLRHFLTAFSSGQPLYSSVREARERLHILEDEYPCATWLPVICQNPAVVPTTWQELCPSKWDPPVLRIRTVLLLSVVITALVMGVRQLGILQPLELQTFDQLMRLRPEEGPDPRLLVVAISEADIQSQKQRQGSLSDPTLAQLLKKLERYQPRAIGLDIYRDLPVGPNQPDLTTHLQQDDRLVAVCKVSDSETNDPGIPPPPEIPLERLGFSDVVADDNNIVRRQLLHLTPPPTSSCFTKYAFSFQLALRYLNMEGIQAQVTSEGDLQLGNVVFNRLTAHTGGYQKVDARGYQVLLNYRPNRFLEDIALQVTLGDILNDRLTPGSIKELKDRIILIGVTAPSASDYWSTPYNTGQQPSQKQIPGVLLQAQMVSQILSVVLDNRPLLWVWPQWVEVLWIWGWSLVGGLLAWYFRPLLRLGVNGGSALGTLYIFCFVLLTQGGWVPLVPSALVLVVTAGSVVIYTRSRADKGSESLDSEG
jgi:CHASE2 domain-containing sensor protein